MLDKDKIGARLGALRKSRGFSQALLSERLNVSPQAVSKWETGQSIPDLETLVALSWIYRVSINTLLGNDMPVEAVAGIERKYLLLEQLLQCPQCRSCSEGEYSLCHDAATGMSLPKDIINTTRQRHVKCGRTGQFPFLTACGLTFSDRTTA